jgi:predicted PurR-regulated permease PerM
MFGRIGLPELMVFLPVIAAMLALVVWPAARICRRIGFSPWLGVLAAFPLVNLILLWVVAFSAWPGLDTPARRE